MTKIPIRAAGTRTAKGVEAVAKVIKRFMVEHKTDYWTAANNAMITCDEIWTEDEHAAFREAYLFLYGPTNS